MTEPGFETTVTDIQLERQAGLRAVWRMSLDRTEFQPGDHGVLEAVTRTGTRLQIPVSEVVLDAAGVLWHVVEKPLAAGTDVRGRVAVWAAPASEQA